VAAGDEKEEDVMCRSKTHVRDLKRGRNDHLILVHSELRELENNN